MSDFTFSCPSCQQLIQASSEHAGMELECPVCQTRLICPAPPGAAAEPERNIGSSPPGAPPPPAPPGAGKGGLRTAKSTATMETKPEGFGVFMGAPQKKKKSKFTPGLIGGIAVALVLIVAGAILGPKYYKQYQQKKADEAAAAAAAAAAAEAAAHPPPEPEAPEIMQKMAGQYKSAPSFYAESTTTANLDVPQMAVRQQNFTANTTMEFSRPDRYRIEWTRQIGANPVKGAAWDAGKGNFVAIGRGAPTRRKDLQAALADVTANNGGLTSVQAGMFFSDPRDITLESQSLTKGPGENLNGKDCYVLNGEVNYTKAKIWVAKDNFLIQKISLTLTGQLDQAEYQKQTNNQVKAQMMQASKITGTIDETYQNIDTSKTLDAAAFDKPISMAAASSPPQRAQGQRAQATSPDAADRRMRKVEGVTGISTE